MLRIVGLLTEGNEGLIPYAIRMIKRKKLDFGLARGFKDTFSRPCAPYFVGVWDTVSSVGWVYDAVRFPYTKATHNPDLHIVRHAISIDERRAFFRQNLFGAPADPTQDVKEVWFAGVHSDVGGGYPESESQLAQTALRWMLCEAETAGLKVDAARKADILGGKPQWVKPDPATRNLHKSLRGWWHVAEVWPKLTHYEDAQHQWHTTIRLNLWRRRMIGGNPQIHESVEQRLAIADLGYRPSNLPMQRSVDRAC
jgi:uncharacterized protein (DUF2235 family)